MATFYVPAVNLIGKGVVNEVGPYIKELGYKKALLVTDKFIEGSDILPKVLKPLDAEGIEYVIFSDVEPNPTCSHFSTSNIHVSLTKVQSTTASKYDYK